MRNDFYGQSNNGDNKTSFDESVHLFSSAFWIFFFVYVLGGEGDTFLDRSDEPRETRDDSVSFEEEEP